MRTWVLPLISVLAALAVGYMHLTVPVANERAENPMLWATDAWTTWEQLRPSDAAEEWGGGDLPAGEWLRRFSNEQGLEVWHAELEWPSLPEGWQQKAWRGGWLTGTEASLLAWSEGPGAMAQHWKEGEGGARLERAACGWAWRGEGWVVWPDAMAPCASDLAAGATSWTPTGSGAPTSWWTGHWSQAPASWGPSQVVQECQAVGIPVTGWGTWWQGGGRLEVDGGEAWREAVQEVASTQGWTVFWVDDDVVVNGGEAWGWEASAELYEAQNNEGRWTGSSLANPLAVVWTRARTEARAEVAQGPGEAGWDALVEGNRDLGTVRNHRTQTRMTVMQLEDGVVAEQADGTVVWGFKSVEHALPGGAEEVDVYANGKYQTMLCFPSGLHLIDVKGREVSGFPVKASEGRWSAWALVDYEGTRKYRYLVASDATGLVENFRREGERTPGWRHRPAEGIEVGSPVRHIAHLRLGSRDYIYVGRENGQVELLKRDGKTRTSTPVQVHAAQPPMFRKGADLDGTSVLFVDASGWVREFTLGQGEEVGLSGATRADRVESIDVDGDGRDEVVTWWRGERSVWNARNEKVE